MTHLPFTIGVLSDVSKGANTRPLRDRRFRVVDARNFDEYLKSRHPTLRLPLQHVDESGQAVTVETELRFESIIDFDPEAVGRRVPVTARLLGYKTSLTELLEALAADYNIEDVFSEIMSDADLRADFYRRGASALAHLPCWIQATSRRSRERTRMLEQQLEDLVNYQPAFPTRVMREPGNLLRAMIDHLEGALRQAVNQLLGHPAFSRLEATWRSLQSLVTATEDSPEIRVAVLDCTRQELTRDLQRRDDPAKSILFDKIFNDGIGSFGGFPIGVVIGDFYISRENEDLELLRGIGSICAMAHTAFVTAAAPSLLGCERFSELPNANDLASMLKHPSWSGWHEFRTSKPARNTAILVPRFLLREPYRDIPFGDDTLTFSESAQASPAEEGLWGNAAFLLAIDAARSFRASGWFARGGGTEPEPVAGSAQFRPEAAITATRALSLLELGFMPVCLAATNGAVVFPSFSTCYRPRVTAMAAEKNNEYIATRLDVVLDAGRFAHLAKAHAQNKVFATIDPDHLREVFNEFLAVVPLAGSCFDGKVAMGMERPPGNAREYAIVLDTVVRANLVTTPLTVKVSGLVLG